MRTRHAPEGRRGFTLTELLIVVAVVAVLAALLSPGIASVQASAKATACASNLRQLAAACRLYAQDNDGKFPTTYLYRSTGSSTPGILDYVAENDRAKIFKCPALARDGQIAPAYLADTGGNTYTVSLTASSNANAGIYALIYLSRIDRPARTAWIMDGAWNGSFFNSVIGRNQLEYLARLQYPHKGRQNIVFVDGHVEALTRDEVPTDPLNSFWTGK